MKKEKGKKEKKNNMGPRANFNLVLLPPVGALTAMSAAARL